MRTMLADLERTLPDITARVTLDDLLCVEREKFGAAVKAQMHFGSNYLQHFEISHFPASG